MASTSNFFSPFDPAQSARLRTLCARDDILPDFERERCNVMQWKIIAANKDHDKGAGASTIQINQSGRVKFHVVYV